MRRKNPDREEIKSLLEQAGDEPLRWIRDHKGNLYVWPAQEGGHANAARELGIEWPWRQGLILPEHEAGERSGDTGRSVREPK